jgi:hypothetical protein
MSENACQNQMDALTLILLTSLFEISKQVRERCHLLIGLLFLIRLSSWVYKGVQMVTIDNVSTN